MLTDGERRRRLVRAGRSACYEARADAVTPETRSHHAATDPGSEMLVGRD